MMRQDFILAAFLALIWCGLTFSVAPSNVIFGVALAAIIVGFLGDEAVPRTRLRLRPLLLLQLLFVLLREIVLSTVQVARLGLSSRLKISPGFVEYDLSVKRDGHIALLAQLITLTPGTLSVVTTENCHSLKVHALEARDSAAVADSISGAFEQRVLSALPYDNDDANAQA